MHSPSGSLSLRLIACIILVLGHVVLHAAPVVSNITAAQRPGTKLVDITYNVAAPGFATVEVSLQASSDGGATWTVPVASVTGAVGAGVAPGTGKTIVWDAGTDWPRSFSSQMRFRVVADDGFAFIPGGSFTMGVTSGDSFNDSPYDSPSVTVTVGSFYLQQKETTKVQWDEVRSWAVNNGYALAVGAAKGSNHPVQSVSWSDVVTWCNARSEKEGLTPVYTAEGGVIRTVGWATAFTQANWSANGYRLPTEAEWEKAARGGVSGKRFPWGTDTISHAQANYRVFSHNGTTNAYSYDVEPRPPATGTDYYHPSYSAGELQASPFTSPVGSFGANGYGLYDMAGNVREWCWDNYVKLYYSNGTTDPRGPASGSGRVIRGGSFSGDAFEMRCSRRNWSGPDITDGGRGFRPARSLIP
jgi:sulfatase modifying factor 1